MARSQNLCQHNDDSEPPASRVHRQRLFGETLPVLYAFQVYRGAMGLTFLNWGRLSSVGGWSWTNDVGQAEFPHSVHLVCDGRS